jgi:hypothetical protein
MWNRVFRARWNRKLLKASVSILLLAGGVLAVLLAGVWALEARAQETICPPGFEWQRMSGVGCVQSNCTEVGGRYTYTVDCQCAEGQKACYTPVDYSDFDQTNCSIWCPGSQLVACVEQDALCPGEEPPDELFPVLPPFGEEEGPDFGGMREELEHFIIGGQLPAPTPERAAAAAVTGTTLLGAWSLVQYLGQRSGGGVKKAVSGTGRVVRKEGADQAAWPEASGARQAEGELVQNVVDVIGDWPGGGDDPVPVAPVLEPPTQRGPVPQASVPVSGPVETIGREVFYGKDALAILIGMGKLSADTNPGEKLLVAAGGFRDFTGEHPDGQPRRIILPAGRAINVAWVEGVGFEGGDDRDSVQIEFSGRFSLTAELVREAPLDLDALTMRSVPPPDEPSPDLEAPTMRRTGPQDDDGEGGGHV